MEQLRQHNERLELLVGEQTKENEGLRRELGSLRGVERENVGLLQSFKLLEERLRSLEEICHEKRHELKAMHEKVTTVETQRDHLQLQIEEIKRDHQERVDAFKAKQFNLVDRIKQLERDQDTFQDEQRRMEDHWKEKVQNARHGMLLEQQDCRQELERSRKENKRLGSEIAGLQAQVQKLLATTVRQTTMIEDCDRVLSDARNQQKTAKASYHDQLQLNGQLNEQIQRLEAQVAAFQNSSESEKTLSEKRIFELESKLTKRKDRIKMMQVTLHEKEKQMQASQRESALRDRNSSHVDEVRDHLLAFLVSLSW